MFITYYRVMFSKMFILILALVAFVIGQDSNSPTVELPYAKYIGYYNATTGINYFRGIPYVQPPINGLRWSKPQPIEYEEKLRGRTFQAIAFGPQCYQSVPEPLLGLTAGLPSSNESEDCLILDVLVPARPASKALPVLLQIHGGGYTEGSAQTFPGDALVHQSEGQIIYVSIQYRLGLFGFLAGTEIEGDGVANAGLYDQRAALEWVQRNIASFGGDPSKVTIWGGSAGGGSVTYQLIAGGGVGNPPFSGAIAEYPWWQPLMNQNSRQLQYAAVLKLTNCTNLACLRLLPAAQLQRANTLSMNTSYPSPGYGYGVFNYGPVVDGKLIKQLPDVEFKQGNFYSVPTIVDHDAHEGAIFSNASQTNQVDETTDARYLFPNAGPSFFSRLYQIYTAAKFNSTFLQRQTWFGDFIINCPTYYMASAMTDRNYNSSAVFKLVFSAGNGLHGATSPFLTSASANFSAASNQTIANIMSRYWISFAITGDPNPLRSQDAPFWPSYGSGGAGAIADGTSVGFDVLSISNKTAVTMKDPDMGAQCDFFSSQGYQVAN